MAGGTAVGVDDDLAAGQAGVADRSADHELAGRIDQQGRAQRLGVVEVGVLAAEHRHDHVLPEVGLDLLLAVDALGVLGRDQDPHDLHRDAVAVAHGHLRLAVRAQVVEGSVLAHRRQPPRQRVRDLHGHRHQRAGLVGRVAEHHSLIAGAVLVELVVVGCVGARLIGLVDPLGDVLRLLIDRRDHRAGVAVEAEIAVVVADLVDRPADDLGDVDVGRRRDLAGDDDQPRVDQRLAGDPAARILREDGVENAVGDLVADLVRVTLRHRLGGEQELALVDLDPFAHLIDALISSRLRPARQILAIAGRQCYSPPSGGASIWGFWRGPTTIWTSVRI